MNVELNIVLLILLIKEVGFFMYKYFKFNDNRIYYLLYFLFIFLKFCLCDIILINYIGDIKRYYKNIKMLLGFFICLLNIG